MIIPNNKNTIPKYQISNNIKIHAWDTIKEIITRINYQNPDNVVAKIERVLRQVGIIISF